MTYLKHLFSLNNYRKLLLDIATGKIYIPEYEDWLEHIDSVALAKVFEDLSRILWLKRREVLYPQEMIIVPRYPFSKRPLIQWSALQHRTSEDPEVAKIKDRCSKLGTLINAGFILKHFVLVDIDVEKEDGGVISRIERLADIKTRRGYHIIRYLPKHEACEFNYKGVKGFKIVVNGDYGRVELMSGKTLLGSYPPQMRYLDFSGGKVNVRRYRELSKEAQISFSSADLTPLESSPGDVEEVINTVLELVGAEGKVSVKPVEKQTSSSCSSSVEVRSVQPHATSKYNTAPLSVLGRLSYSSFKSALAVVEDRLPKCIREALFGDISKGHRFFHLRFLVAILPFFVSFDENSFRDFISDFASRTNSSRSDVRKWVYDSKYFTGRITVGEDQAITASKLGVPSESWSDFYSLGYCSSCILKEQCLKLSSKNRRKLIVDYVAELLSNTV